MSRGNISTTAPVADEATHLPLDSAPGMEDMISLVFFTLPFRGVQDPLEDQKFSHIWSQDRGGLFFCFLFLN